MKKININKSALLKTVLAAVLFAFYWYWINQKLISDSPEAFSLVSYFLLTSTATAYFPLPANLLVLGAVKAASPVMVGLVGGMATLVAYFSEHFFFTVMFKFNKVANFKKTWLYQSMAPLFNRAKFLVISFTSFLPIPSEPLRIYAITQRYPKLRYALAGFIGRTPRYFLLAYFGQDYVNSGWFILAVFIFPALFLLMIRGGVSLLNYLKNKPEGTVTVPIPSDSSTLSNPDSGDSTH